MNAAERLLVIGAAAGAVWVWWRYVRVARPAYPPLPISDDDPLMVEAVRRARAKLDRFRALHAEPNRGARLKVPFITNSGVTEYLWSEVLRLGDADAEVRYLTPPVTHQGRLERVHVHALADAADWLVERLDGTYHGGFTMRVMFVRGRETWGTLPPELAAEERRYVNES